MLNQTLAILSHATGCTAFTPEMLKSSGVRIEKAELDDLYRKGVLFRSVIDGHPPLLMEKSKTGPEARLLKWIKDRVFMDSFSLGEAPSHLNMGQREAWDMCSNEHTSILRGGAGTGKTTVISAIVKSFKGDISLIAPTGKAAE